jgi:hypothetical protein
MRILKMPINFKHGDFSKFPILLGRNEKKSTFITFPSKLKFLKLPEIFSSILENKSHEYFRA